MSLIHPRGTTTTTTTTITLLLLLLLRYFRYAFRARLGAVCVTSLEIALICAIIALAAAIQIYATFKITQIAATAVVNRVQELDGTLAEAIASVVESGLGSFEPPNPIVAILGDYLKSNLNSPITNVEVLQGEDGKFVKKTE